MYYQYFIRSEKSTFIMVLGNIPIIVVHMDPPANENMNLAAGPWQERENLFVTRARQTASSTPTGSTRVLGFGFWGV